jgi:transcriptional regulator with XRE-family HTH domain
LRREEVAQLCGISTTWYTWIEQGRDISVSAAALARLADVLRLTPAERAYLFAVTRRQDPQSARGRTEAADIGPQLRSLLDAIAAPAYLLDRYWSAQAWNEPAGRLFSPWLGGPERCLLRYVFLDAGARDFIDGWEERACRLVAELRADTARSPDDPKMRSLVEGLRATSAHFARFWDDQAVLGREGGTRIFHHPTDGRLRYEQVTLVPATQPDSKLVVLLPGP